jgi:hypothetical protein
MSEKPPYWQRPLTEEELERIEALAAESKPVSDFAAALLERWALHGSYGKDLPTPEDALVAVVRHLVYEIRRLRLEVARLSQQPKGVEEANRPLKTKRPRSHGKIPSGGPGFGGRR